ncbi:PH domain-containing protein [Macrococcus lamae]|nr:PH domain-containing protein [Macrococcus lamae]
MLSIQQMLKEPERVIELKRYHYLCYTLLCYIPVLLLHYFIIRFNWSEWLLLFYILPVISALFMLFAPEIRYRHTAFYIHPVMIETMRGLYNHKRTVTPIDRIQDVIISQGPIASKLGLAKVTVKSSGDEIALPYVTAEEAERLARLIIERVKEVTHYV